MSIRHSILSHAKSIFIDIINGLYCKHSSFNDLVLIYNATVVPEMGVPGSSDSLGLSTSQCSDAQRRTEERFYFLRESARLGSTLNTKNLIILIVASGLVKILFAFGQWEFDDGGS
jgi:hypothetical protein